MMLTLRDYIQKYGRPGQEYTEMLKGKCATIDGSCLLQISGLVYNDHIGQYILSVVTAAGNFDFIITDPQSCFYVKIQDGCACNEPIAIEKIDINRSTDARLIFLEGKTSHLTRTLVGVEKEVKTITTCLSDINPDSRLNWLEAKVATLNKQVEGLIERADSIVDRLEEHKNSHRHCTIGVSDDTNSTAIR